MSFSPALFENEGGGDNLPFGDSEHSVWKMIPSAVRSPGGPTINFSNRTLGSAPGNNRVINATDHKHTVTWSSRGEIEINRAFWLSKDENDRFSEISTANLRQPTTLRRQDGTMVFLNSTALELSVSLIGDIPYFQRWLIQDMYLKIEWIREGKPGSTLSGLFTVYAVSAPKSYEDVVRRLEIEMMNDEQNYGVDEGDASHNVGMTTASPTQSPTPSAATSISTGSEPTSSLGAGASDDNSGGGGGGGGGGLPPGAIAGIVIGVVFGLGLIAFLAWFFLRRRRRADHVSDGTYGSGHGPHEYLADKETHARVTESPHSPYSDDGRQHQQPQPHINQPDHEAVLPASATSPTDCRSFAPYSEEEHTPIAARSMDDITRAGVRSSTPNVNSNVSHLIEDGMTEDEIRRLEEEERVLDAAIEQAGQGQGGSAGSRILDATFARDVRLLVE